MTATSTLVLASFIIIFVCYQLAFINYNKPLFFQVKLLFYIPYVKWVILYIKFLEDIQDTIIYEEFITADDLDNDKKSHYYLDL